MRLIRLLPLLLALTACDQRPPYVASTNDAVIQNGLLPPPVALSAEAPVATPSSTVPAALSVGASPWPPAAQAARYPSPKEVFIDASSPERFVESLQEAEMRLSPQHLEDLKTAILMLTDRAQRRYLRQTALTNQPVPKNEVFERAYGDLDGASVYDVIQQGAEHARDYVRLRESRQGATPVP